MPVKPQPSVLPPKPRAPVNKGVKKPSGGQKGAMNNFRTSVWANLFTPEEVAFAEQHTWSDVSMELEIVRIRLRRMLIAEAKQLHRDGSMTDAELEEIVTEVYKTHQGKKVGEMLERKKFRRTDFTSNMNVLLSRFESLTRLQLDLHQAMKQPGQGSTDGVIGTIRVEVVGGKVVTDPEDPEAAVDVQDGASGASDEA